MIDDIIGKYLGEAKVDKKKAGWMKSYEDVLSKRKDYKPGRIDWDTATFLYNQGNSPEEASKKASEPFK